MRSLQNYEKTGCVGVWLYCQLQPIKGKHRGLVYGGSLKFMVSRGFSDPPPE